MKISRGSVVLLLTGFSLYLFLYTFVYLAYMAFSLHEVICIIAYGIGAFAIYKYPPEILRLWIGAVLLTITIFLASLSVFDGDILWSTLWSAGYFGLFYITLKKQLDYVEELGEEYDEMIREEKEKYGGFWDQFMDTFLRELGVHGAAESRAARKGYETRSSGEHMKSFGERMNEASKPDMRHIRLSGAKCKGSRANSTCQMTLKKCGKCGTVGCESGNTCTNSNFAGTRCHTCEHMANAK